MPWLSRPATRQNSAEHVDETFGGSSNGLQNMLNEQNEQPITFIPAQIDGLCGTTAPGNLHTPVMLVRESCAIFMRNLSCLPSMARSFCTMTTLREYMKDQMASRDLILQCCLGVMQMCILATMGPMIFFMPGMFMMPLMGLWWAVMRACMWPLNKGKRVTQMMPENMGGADENADESWIYVNGMMTSHNSMTQHLTRLTHTFRRPITGIHNPTRGPLLDILAMLLSPLFPSSTTLPLTTHLRTVLISPNTRKVIIIAHGTGAIALSAALDSLHADLPMATMSKLEVYTFGSAARHLNNPLLALDELSRRDVAFSISGGVTHGNAERVRSRSPNPQGVFTRQDGSIASPVKATLASLGHRVEDLERVMLHVEHYAMVGDLVARCGVVEAVMGGASRFVGRLFLIGEVRGSGIGREMPMRRGSGMSAMMEKMRRGSDTAVVAKTGVRGGCGTFGEYMDALFPRADEATAGTEFCLDVVVSVDARTAERREFSAEGISSPLKSLHRMGMAIGAHSQLSSQSLETSPRSRKEKLSSWGTTGALGVDSVGKARMGARECQGRTVRQLSRLWKFGGGEKPVGEGVCVANGVGLAGLGKVGMQNGEGENNERPGGVI